MMYRCLILLTLICSNILFSQNDSTVTIEDYLVKYFDENNIDDENSEIVTLIEDFIRNPINLNNATLSELLSIPFIDNLTAENIIKYRSKHGKFFSLNELALIKDIDPELLRFLKPLLTIKTSVDSSDEIIESQDGPVELTIRSRMLADLQERKGFREENFIGNKYKSYTRIKSSYIDKYSAGLLFENDPGEESLTDFTSFNISIKDVYGTDIILGDYLVQFGQGLSLWSPYSSSKGNNPVDPVSRYNRGIIPYSGADEMRFLRGVAFKKQFQSIQLTSFYSNNIWDASLTDDKKMITSINYTGYHRTDSEITKKDNIKNTTYGIALSYLPLQRLDLSFLAYQVNFNKNFLPQSIDKLQGNNFRFYSSSYNLNLGTVGLTGEISYNSESFASINNFSFQPDKDLTFVVSIRNYPADFVNIYSNGFGENSNTINEFGLYFGLRLKTMIGTVNIYYDNFRLGANSNTPFPNDGFEVMLNYETRLTSGTKLFLRFFHEEKGIDETTDLFSAISQRTTDKFRLDFTYEMNRNLRLKSRIEYIHCNYEISRTRENGYLLFQDIRYNLARNLRSYFRVIFFQTESYNSRLYVFENDLPGALSNPPLYGKGLRWYFLINYTLHKNLTLSLKYSELYKPDEKSLGSGFGEIYSNLDNRISLQMDFSL